MDMFYRLLYILAIKTAAAVTAYEEHLANATKDGALRLQVIYLIKLLLPYIIINGA